MVNPTERTLKRLRDHGYQVAVVERWNMHARIRQDLFGWCDIVAIREDLPGVLGIQACRASHSLNRFSKIIQVPALRVWLKSGNRAEVWGWAKGERCWKVKRRNVRLEDLSLKEEIES